MTQHDRKLIRSSAWNAVGAGGTQVLTFLATIALARLLTPHAFGLVTLASLPLLALTYVQESGLTAAVIREREDLERAASTQLVFGIASSLVLYAISFFGAPLLADVFSQPALTEIFRVLALVVVLRGIGVAPGALLERDLSFDKRARADVVSAVVQALVSIALAAAGVGVWSLVAGRLAGQAAQSAAYWAYVPFRISPRLANLATLRRLGRYGRHIALSNLLLLVNDNADNFAIGRLLGATSVGIYNLAWRLANLPALEVGLIVGRTTFAVYSSFQDDLRALQELFLATARRVTFLALPLAAGILVAAEPLVVGVFGERWRPAVGVLQILTVFGMSRTFAGITASVFQVAGRPQLNYQIGLWYTAVLLGALFLLAPAYGTKGVAVADLLGSVLSMIPCYVFALRILEIRPSELFAHLVRPCMSALIVSVVLLALRTVTHTLPPLAELVVLTVAGTAAYVGTLLTLGRSELRMVVGAFRPEPSGS